MTDADRARRCRQRKKVAGLVRLDLWTPREHHAAIRAFAQSLAADPPICNAPAGEGDQVAGSTDPVAGKAPLAVSVAPVAVNTTGG